MKSTRKRAAQESEIEAEVSVKRECRAVADSSQTSRGCKEIEIKPKKPVKWNPYLVIEEDSHEKSQFKVKAARRRKTVDSAPAKSETYDSRIVEEMAQKETPETDPAPAQESGKHTVNAVLCVFQRSSITLH